MNFTTTQLLYIASRPSMFDSELVEAGPTPQLLSTGDYIFFHNSAGTGGYHAEFAIINGTQPDAPPIQRAMEPLLSPVYDFELGIAPAECNVPNVVFLEAVAPVEGMEDTFDVWFGGSDAVVSTARVSVTKN